MQRDCKIKAPIKLRPGIDELLLTSVPDVEKLLGGRRADQTRVNEAGETDSGNMTARAEHAVEVPDGLRRSREVVCEESACFPTRDGMKSV